MLIIRKEQMQAFEGHLQRHFRSRLQRHLRKEFEVECGRLSDLDLEKLIHQAVERGHVYGVTSERDVSLFTDLMVLKGANFDHDSKLPWIRKTLLRQDLDGGAKMQVIYNRLGALEERKAMPESPP